LSLDVVLILGFIREVTIMSLHTC